MNNLDDHIQQIEKIASSELERLEQARSRGAIRRAIGRETMKENQRLDNATKGLRVAGGIAGAAGGLAGYKLIKNKNVAKDIKRYNDSIGFMGKTKAGDHVFSSLGQAAATTGQKIKDTHSSIKKNNSNPALALGGMAIGSRIGTIPAKVKRQNMIDETYGKDSNGVRYKNVRDAILDKNNMEY